jgi:hypothetical protein
VDSEDEMQAALDAELQKRRNWLNAENTRRRLDNKPPLSESDPYVQQRWAQMQERWLARNSESDEAEAGLKDELDFHLPSADFKSDSTFEFEIYKMVAHLLNQLDDMGENLIAFCDDSGETELSGAQHAVRYDQETNKWVMGSGRDV